MVQGLKSSERMNKGPRQGLSSAILVWAIGLALGIGAGALTARLLIPERDGSIPAEGRSLRDRIFGN
jgi:hypothetical protein